MLRLSTFKSGKAAHSYFPDARIVLFKDVCTKQKYVECVTSLERRPIHLGAQRWTGRGLGCARI